MNTCQHAIAQVGGRAQKCGAPASSQLLVRAADKQGAELIHVCAYHASRLTTRQQGSLYREGQDGPVQIKL